jgi:hypothetical protein
MLCWHKYFSGDSLILSFCLCNGSNLFVLSQTNTVTSVLIQSGGVGYLSGDLLVKNDKNQSGFIAKFIADIESGSVM